MGLRLQFPTLLHVSGPLDDDSTPGGTPGALRQFGGLMARLEALPFPSHLLNSRVSPGSRFVPRSRKTGGDRKKDP